MAEMFDENEAATMAAVKRVTDAQRQKGNKALETGGEMAGMVLGLTGLVPPGVAGRGNLAELGSHGADALRSYLKGGKGKEVAPEESGWFDDEQVL
jgi:hypothetical protein